MGKFSQLGILRHPRYDDRLSEIVAEFPRAREVVAGAEIYLSRNPEDGVVHPSYDVRMARLAATASCPPLLIFYSVNRRYITLLTIMVGDKG